LKFLRPLLRNGKVIFYRIMYYNNQAKHYKVGRRREMKIKGLLGKDKEPTVKAEAETKWKPKPAGKGAKSKKRF
jgi:hypothetical protein